MKWSQGRLARPGQVGGSTFLWHFGAHSNGLVGPNAHYCSPICPPLGPDCLVILVYFCNSPDRREMLIVFFFFFFHPGKLPSGSWGPQSQRLFRVYVNGPQKPESICQGWELHQVLKAQIAAETKAHPFIWSRQAESPRTGLPGGAWKLDLDHCCHHIFLFSLCWLSS